jgi:hypothetical protein
MDLRTFRRNGPGLAECESEAAWRRLWGGPSGASVPGHARTGLECGRILATIWIPKADPFNAARGAPIQRCARRAREKSLATELGFEGHVEWAERDDMTAVVLHPH